MDVPAPRVMLVRAHDCLSPFGPPRAITSRTNGDLQHLLFFLLRRVVVSDEAAVCLHLAQIVIRRHVTAAIPALVADPQIADLIRSGMAVSSALFRQCR